MMINTDEPFDISTLDDNELYMLYEENDENAKNLLFLKYKFIIDILVKKYLKAVIALNMDIQELYSEANLAFSDALRCYDIDNKSSLPTFITLCVERKIGNIVHRYSTLKYKSMNESLSLDYIYEGSKKDLKDIISDQDSDPLINITEKESYDKLISIIEKKLSKKENEVFTLLLKNFSNKEISKILNLTSKQLDNISQRLKNKIKEILKNQKIRDN